MFYVEIKKSAKKELDLLLSVYKNKIIDAIKILKEDQRPFIFYDLRKVAGRENVYGIRIGKYRILYEIFNDQKLILVFKIEHKSDTTYKPR